MVDVSAKPATEREALAEGRVIMSPATLAIVQKGDAKKGDVLGAARIAGIMAAKRTHDLIPLCHPLAISKVEVDLRPDAKLPGIRVRARVKDAFQGVGDRQQRHRFTPLRDNGRCGHYRAKE